MRVLIPQAVASNFGILLVRVMVGCVFSFHGVQKLLGWWNGQGLAGFAAYLEQIQVPWPAYGAVLAGAAELVGGLALITGIWMRTMSIPLMATMGTAIWFAHSQEFDIQRGGMEYPLTLAVATLGLALMGPGRFSVSGIWDLPLWNRLRQGRQLDITSEPSFPSAESASIIRGIRTASR